MIEVNNYPDYFQDYSLDGQHLYLLTEEGVDYLTNVLSDSNSKPRKYYGEIVCNLILTQIQLTQSDKKLKFAIGFVGLDKKLHFYNLYNLEGIQYRVYFEKIKCNYCNWIGFIANPTIVDNFIGVCNKQIVYDKIKNLKMKKCTNCNNGLNRPAIYIF
jgi:hypothetical protein